MQLLPINCYLGVCLFCGVLPNSFWNDLFRKGEERGKERGISKALFLNYHVEELPYFPFSKKKCFLELLNHYITFVCIAALDLKYLELRALAFMILFMNFKTLMMMSYCAIEEELMITGNCNIQSTLLGSGIWH